RSELRVHAHEQVLVETCGDAPRVVVGALVDRPLLAQVDAHEKTVAWGETSAAPSRSKFPMFDPSRRTRRPDEGIPSSQASPASYSAAMPRMESAGWHSRSLSELASSA